MNGLIKAVLLIMAIVIGTAFVISSAQSLETGTDITGSPYENVTDDTTEAAQTTLSIMAGIASILGVAALLIALCFMRSQIK